LFLSKETEDMKFIFILVLFPMALRLQAQLPAANAYEFIKSHSIHRNSIQWDTIDKGFYDHLKKATSQKDTIQSLIYVFEQLNDIHSSLLINGRSYANYPVFDDTSMANLRPLVVRSQAQTGIIKTARLGQHIAYIQIPGINAWGEAQVNAYAQAISDSLCELGGKKLKGLIIDLRLNGGGQLSSMIAGLHALLGDNYLGGGVDINLQETRPLKLRAGNFFIGELQTTAIGHQCDTDLSLLPVVVLIGPVTRSSGSITAIAFKQRPHTYFIGEPTADGYTTGNDYFTFADNFSLNLSTEYHQDRSGIVYKKAVPPDKIVYAGDDFDDLNKDLKIIKALEWFRQ
jgi:hypothetical protein